MDFNVPFAHTPAFVGSHTTGYDNVMKGIVEHFWNGKAGTVPKLERQPNGKLNFFGGFDGYTVGNMREIKRLFDLMGVEYTILGDNSDVWDTPSDGEFRMYDGGTTLEIARADCRDHGCRARLACPVGAAHRYLDPQAQFHLAAFVGAIRPG